MRKAKCYSLQFAEPSDPKRYSHSSHRSDFWGLCSPCWYPDRHWVSLPPACSAQKIHYQVSPWPLFFHMVESEIFKKIIEVIKIAFWEVKSIPGLFPCFFKEFCFFSVESFNCVSFNVMGPSGSKSSTYWQLPLYTEVIQWFMRKLQSANICVAGENI